MQKMSIKDSHQYVGPYRLDKTLGKGQTGLVRLGIHCVSGKKVAVKIVNRERLTEVVLMKVEREIAIMKLVEHPHVLGLYDVYESKKYLFLILEYVSGGELFDYLVKKGRLSSKEARYYFRQIISALNFCHSLSVCHRDLKPENLLLDDKNTLRVADFGMASLQVNNTLLETSCGSPHYACPEVIRGEKYDGKKADVWSCGVILYALLVGALPFDDDNLRQLLEKVKKGTFHIPHFVPADCQQILRGMIEVDPAKRLELDRILCHPWVTTDHGAIELELPMCQIVQTSVIPSCADLDPDILATMTSLQCFKDRQKLVDDLLCLQHNAEKVIYYLLLDRKLRLPSADDSLAVLSRSPLSPETPRKRTDILRLSKQSRLSFGAVCEGSPVASRRALAVHQMRKASTNVSPFASPRLGYGQHTVSGTSTRLPCHVPGVTPPSSPGGSLTWRSRLHSLRNNLLGTPRFHRKRPDDEPATPVSKNEAHVIEPVKRSWFGALLGLDHDERHHVIIPHKTASQIRADLIQAFFCTPELCHSPVSATSFRVELRRPSGASILTRNVKFQADIVSLANEGATVQHCVTFTLLVGPFRRFRRICEVLQSMLVAYECSSSTTQHRRVSSSGIGSEHSLSNSSSYSSLERISPSPSELAEPKSVDAVRCACAASKHPTRCTCTKPSAPVDCVAAHSTAV